MAVKKRTDSYGQVLYCGEYQRKDGRYSYKYLTREGEKKIIYARQLAELRLAESKILFLEHINISKNIVNLTLNDQFELWYASKLNIRGNTRADYKNFYDSYVRNSLGKKNIYEITTFDIKSLYMSLLVSRRLSVNSLAHIQNVLYQVLRSGVESNVITANPAKDACKEFERTHSKHTSLRPGLSVKQAEALMDFVRDNEECSRWYPFICFMIGTGLRLSEAAGIRWKDIDLEHGIIDVNHSIVYFNRSENSAAGLRASNLKNAASHRKIPIGKRTVEALLMEKEYQKKNHVKCNAVVDGYTDFVFLNRFGGVITQEAVNRAIKRIVFLFNASLENNPDAKCGPIPAITSHSFRHTYANYLCEKHVNIKVAQRLLGQADIETTMNIYTSVSQEFVEDEYHGRFD